MVPMDELEEHSTRTRWRRAVTPLVIGVACAVVLVLILQPADENSEPKRMGDFELPLLSGGLITDEDLRGKPIVLNFFASWCPPCREEAGVLQKGWERYEDEVQFIGVDVRDTPEDARAFVNEFGVTYPIIKDYDETLAKRLGVGLGLPVTYFIDGDLQVASSESGTQVGSANGNTTLGAIDPAELEAGIEELLGGE